MGVKASMSVRDEDEGFRRETRQIPFLTAQDALQAGTSAERRRILETIQRQQAKRAEQLDKLCRATLSPKEPAFITQERLRVNRLR